MTDETKSTSHDIDRLRPDFAHEAAALVAQHEAEVAALKAEVERLKALVSVAYFQCYSCGFLTDNRADGPDGRKYCRPCLRAMAGAKDDAENGEAE